MAAIVISPVLDSKLWTIAKKKGIERDEVAERLIQIGLDASSDLGTFGLNGDDLPEIPGDDDAG